MSERVDTICLPKTSNVEDEFVESGQKSFLKKLFSLPLINQCHELFPNVIFPNVIIPNLIFPKLHNNPEQLCCWVSGSIGNLSWLNLTFGQGSPSFARGGGKASSPSQLKLGEGEEASPPSPSLAGGALLKGQVKSGYEATHPGAKLILKKILKKSSGILHSGLIRSGKVCCADNSACQF